MRIIDDIGDRAIWNAIVETIQKPDPKRMRVTELIDSPRIKYLRLKHWDEVKDLASESLFRLLGTSIHNITHLNADANTLSEEKLSLTIDLPPFKYTIFGTPDLYTSSGELVDYKITSLWSFLRGKEEWEAQLNIYRKMLTSHGFPVSNLQIRAILKDWNKSESLRKPDYPKSAFKKLDIPLWSDAQFDLYVFNRMAAHDQFTPAVCCTDQERWRKPTTFAVRKKGLVKAKAVFGTDKRPGGMEEAQKYIEEMVPAKDHKLYFIETRPGRYTRCEGYCNVADFCEYWQADKKLQEQAEEGDE